MIDTYGGKKRVGPKQLPNAATDEILVDFWIQEMHISNPTDTAVVVSAYDRQTPAVAVVPPTTLYKGSMVSLDSAIGRLVLGGLTWSSTPAGADGWIIGFATP